MIFAQNLPVVIHKEILEILKEKLFRQMAVELGVKVTQYLIGVPAGIQHKCGFSNFVMQA